MKKVIVTGGAGFIGSNLVKLLLDKGHKVTVIDDLSVGKRENLDIENKNLKFVKEDIRVKEKMISLTQKADIIYHLAVQCVRKSIRDPWLVHSVNAEGTLLMLEKVHEACVKKFIYCSDCNCNGFCVSDVGFTGAGGRKGFC